MWERIKDIFYFSRGEKNGIMVLLVILVILISFPYVVDLFLSNEANVNKEFEEEIIDFKKSLEETEKPEYNNRLNQYIIERYDSIKLFHFNPNSTSREQFKKLGLTEKQISTILNYKNKGGRFDEKDDFRKIYGIRHKQYQILKPYILLPDKKHLKRTGNKLSTYESRKADSLFVFDPNTADIEDFIKLGLSEKQAKTVGKYREKGGFFRNKKDFRKIYTISENLHDKLEPYIFINSKDAKNSESKKLFISDLVDLNRANLDELIKIKGIGNYTAKMILNYRKNLGGFVNINQLKEIKKLNKDNFENYKSRLKVDRSVVKKISINFSEIKELSAHPYINYQQAKQIIEYRTKNGSYTSIKQILNNKIMLNESYKKVEPYLKLN